jgi:ABC-type Zn uptake system ZnuABC Zn-binding protein ZnuA
VPRPSARSLAALLAAAGLALGACGGAAAGPGTNGGAGTVAGAAEARDACLAGAPLPDGSRLRVATTVSPITSIVANVAGGAADITGLVPEGTNSHTFEPPPSAAAVLGRADVVFANGLGLEDPTADLATGNRPEGGVFCELGTAVLPPDEWIFDFSFPREGGKPNPHVWTDPVLARRYVALVADVLADRDPAHAEAYRANAAAFTARLDELDGALRTATATVPEGQRRLLTYHDAYAYWARDYGWEVIGAIQPSSFEEPTPREVAELIDQVRSVGVPAIFGSEVFPSPVLAQIGREAGVRYVDELRDDDLPGDAGDPGHSYLGLLRFDYATVVASLGGDASALEALDVSDVAPDTAEYPR